MTDKLEFRVLQSSTPGSWDVMSRDPSTGGLTSGWSLMTVARDASEVGEAILEEVEFRTVDNSDATPEHRSHVELAPDGRYYVWCDDCDLNLGHTRSSSEAEGWAQHHESDPTFGVA